MISSDLLHYNIQPTVLDTSIKHPRMVNPGQDYIFIRQNTQPGGIEVHTTEADIQIDTKAARESMGLRNLSDESFIRMHVQKAKQDCADFTRQTARDGEAMVRQRMSPAQIAKQHYWQDRQVEPSQAQLTFIPSEDADVDVQRGGVDITHHPTEVNIDWANTGIVPYQLDRGTVTFNVVQRAYVDIMYMGAPDYFPDSAAPEFSARA